ncbi:MAG: hypothetical protein PHU14_02615, partial [Methylovulum sp.]|nr:hypothetical protein [Methylovulum sp.]
MALWFYYIDFKLFLYGTEPKYHRANTIRRAFTMNNNPIDIQDTFDHGAHKEFVEYYAEKSLSDVSINRMKGTFDCIGRRLKDRGHQKLSVADIGCGAGVMSTLWAQAGHDVHGLGV